MVRGCHGSEVELPLVAVNQFHREQTFGEEIDDGPLINRGLSFARGFDGLETVLAEQDIVLAIESERHSNGSSADFLVIEPNDSAAGPGGDGNEAFDTAGE